MTYSRRTSQKNPAESLGPLPTHPAGTTIPPQVTDGKGWSQFNEWSMLVGARVEIRRSGQVFRAGDVDAVTADSRMLWLAPESPHGRILIEKAEGHEVWIRPEQLRSLDG
jgi:hypothetical protein